MAQLDQDIPGTSSGSAAEEFSSSPALFSDQEFSEHEAKEKTDPCSQENSLFPDQTTHTATRTKRTRGNKKVNCPPVGNISSSDSSDYEPPKKFNLKEILANHFHNKKKLAKARHNRTAYKKKKRENRYLRCLGTGKKPRKAFIRTPTSSLPLNQKRRRMFHRGLNFPFTSRKYLPLKLCFSYEQSVIGGFLSYIKKIKCVKHLKNSLNNMSMPESVDEENFLSRDCGFLDDEESISPISESGDDENEAEDHDAVIVENNSFILSCNIPSKKEWQKKKTKQSTKKKKKRALVIVDERSKTDEPRK